MFEVRSFTSVIKYFLAFDLRHNSLKIKITLRHQVSVSAFLLGMETLEGKQTSPAIFDAVSSIK